ncbi:MAG: 3-phosphoglycerate dehydrogenase, partial [Bacteroidetes bacterium]|nr:3-phosphoglycerate dehydrogenase [Bacteroidota bacterium]
EVIKRAIAFGMHVVAFDKFKSEDFAREYGFNYCKTLGDLFSQSDIISLNLPLSPGTGFIIDSEALSVMKNGIIIINTARAGLVDQNIIIDGVKSGKIMGYLTDVLEEEPMVNNHPFLEHENILITPHIGSRTYENVVNQGKMAVENLLKYL